MFCKLHIGNLVWNFLFTWFRPNVFYPAATFRFDNFVHFCKKLFAHTNGTGDKNLHTLAFPQQMQPLPFRDTHKFVTFKKKIPKSWNIWRKVTLFSIKRDFTLMHFSNFMSSRDKRNLITCNESDCTFSVSSESLTGQFDEIKRSNI